MGDGSRPVALVTGAASGIGLATAHRLAADGMVIALVDRDAGSLDVAVEVVASGAGRVLPFVLDVADGEAVDAMIDGLVTSEGPPQVVVNNAGTAVRADVTATDPSDWNRVVAVNLTAVYRVCRAVIPGMVPAGGGAIVNVASVAGMVGIRERAAYCASKAGVIGLTRAIAADHAADGIRANAICPGTVETGWIDRIIAGADDPEAARRAMEERQLDGRMGTPQEVAEGIAFLASDRARFVNGSAFVMDGGMTAV